MVNLSIEVETWLRRITREELIATTQSVSNKEPEAKTAPVQDALLNMKMAAEYFGISTLTLYRCKKRSEIRYYRVENRVLFSIEKHILPFLEARETDLRNSKNGSVSPFSNVVVNVVATGLVGVPPNDNDLAEGQ